MSIPVEDAEANVIFYNIITLKKCIFYVTAYLYQEVFMYFKRKAYDRLLEWKKLYSDRYAALLEGARRVGKSTIAESFAKNEYKSYILIDFSKTTSNILECFDDIANLNIFFYGYKRKQE